MGWFIMETRLYLLSFFVGSAVVTNEKECIKPSSTLRHVQYCPVTQEEWENYSIRMNCSQYIFRCPEYAKQLWEYHCVIDTLGTQLLEVCAPSVNVIGGNCAEFNIKGDIIQENTNAPCQEAMEQCPFSYPSTTAYKFPGCFRLPFRKVMSTEIDTKTQGESSTLDIRSGENSKKDSSAMTILISAVGILIVLIAFLLLWKSNILERIPSLIGRRERNLQIEDHQENSDLIASNDDAGRRERNLQIEDHQENSDLIASNDDAEKMCDVACMTDEGALRDPSTFQPTHRVSLSWGSIKSIKSIRTTASEVSRRSSLYIQEENDTSKQPQTIIVFAVGNNYSKYGYITPASHSVITTTKSYSRSEKNSAVASAILLDTNMKTIDFGNTAETTYATKYPCSKHFFKHLLDLNTIDDDLFMCSTSGKIKKAKTVMSEYIKALLSVTEIDSITSDIKYVFTIPNSWDDSRKRLMEESAVLAGIEKRNICVVKVIDTILPYVNAKQGYDVKNYSENVENSRKPLGLLVVHLGKARFEFVLQHIQDGASKTKGTMSFHNKDWGESSIESSCLEFLSSLFGCELLSQLKKNHPSDFLVLLENIDRLNESMSTSGTGKSCLRLPETFEKLVVNNKQLSIAEIIKANEKYKSEIKYKDGQLLIEKEVYHSFVKPSIDLLHQELQQWFGNKKHSDASFLCITGGYSNSNLFQNVIVSFFRDKSIIIPHHAHIVNIEGAIRMLMSFKM